MIRVKIIWKDNSESYAMGMGLYTQFVDKAKNYRSVLIAARTARKIKATDDLVKDAVVVTDTDTYKVW